MDFSIKNYSSSLLVSGGGGCEESFSPIRMGSESPSESVNNNPVVMAVHATKPLTFGVDRILATTTTSPATGIKDRPSDLYYLSQLDLQTPLPYNGTTTSASSSPPQQGRLYYPNLPLLRDASLVRPQAIRIAGDRGGGGGGGGRGVGSAAGGLPVGGN